MGAIEVSHTAALAVRELQDRLAAACKELACTQVRLSWPGRRAPAKWPNIWVPCRTAARPISLVTGAQ
jgi:hypothetical protein